MVALATVLTLSFGSVMVASANDSTASTGAEVEFKVGSGSMGPTDPENPDKPGPGPGTGNSGPLTIDMVPHFDFGIHEVELGNQTYPTVSSLNDLAHFVQVTDRRGTNAGWTLRATKDDAFMEASSNRTLGATTITLKDMKVSSQQGALGIPASSVPTNDIVLHVGVTQDIIVVPNNAGNFTNNIRFGDKNDTLDKVELFVPAAAMAQVLAGDVYSTTVTWTLVGAPTSP